MEGGIVRKGLKNIRYVLTSQFIFYLLGFMVTFILPKLLGIKPYGYYYMYILYTNYVGMLHFGFNDGIYLKFGGYDYDNLPRELFRSFMRFYLMFTTGEILVFSVLLIFESDPYKKFALFFAILNILVVNASKMFNNINQVTNRMKIYSFVVVAENVQILAAIFILLAIHRIDFHIVIVCDFLAKCVVLLINIYCDRDLVFGKMMSLKEAFKDCADTFRVGIKLMIANLLGSLILDLGNFILSFGSVKNFSYYSFASNSILIAMMFISAVSLVLYPMLCRFERSALPRYYMFINRLLCAVIFCMMLLYYPLVLFINVVLPQYKPVLSYLFLLFPIVIMRGKMQLLINTYYQSLREERAMMVANISSIVVFLVLAVPLFAVFKSIQVIVWATLITFTWRCYASEIFLKRVMGLKGIRNIIEELAMAVVFILSAWLIPSRIVGMLIYAACVAAYIVVNRSEIFFYVKKILLKLREERADGAPEIR